MGVELWLAGKIKEQDSAASDNRITGNKTRFSHLIGNLWQGNKIAWDELNQLYPGGFCGE